MICCYNARSNDPYKESHHPRYTPLDRLDDGMIKQIGIRRFEDGKSDVAFLILIMTPVQNRWIGNDCERRTWSPTGLAQGSIGRHRLHWGRFHHGRLPLGRLSECWIEPGSDRLAPTRTGTRGGRRHGIDSVYATYQEMLCDERIEVVDIAVPPDDQLAVVKEVVRHPQVRGILAQKPLGCCYHEARTIVDLCRGAGITLCVNQNMRYDQSVRACKTLLDRDELGRARAGHHRHAGDSPLDALASSVWAGSPAGSCRFITWIRCGIGLARRLEYLPVFGPIRGPSFRTPTESACTFWNTIRVCVVMICDDVWTGPAREGAAEDIGIRLARGRDRGLGERHDRVARLSRTGAQHH